MNYPWLLAGVISALVFLLHVIAGGIHIAKPLLAARDLHRVPKYTQYYCWHLTSISLALMSLCFFWATLLGGSRDLALLGGGMAGLFALWGLALPFLRPGASIGYRELPQGWLFVPITLLAFYGAQI